MWHAKDRAWLMILAGVVALGTIRVGVLAPPGGFWRHDEAGPGGHQAGQPVMLTRFPASYAWFTRFNAVVFLSSLIIMALLSSERVCGTGTGRATLLFMALLDSAFFFAAFRFGISPEDPLRGLTYLVAGVVVSIIIIVSLVYIAENLPWRKQHGEAYQAAAETVMAGLSHASSPAGGSRGADSQTHPSIP